MDYQEQTIMITKILFQTISKHIKLYNIILLIILFSLNITSTPTPAFAMSSSILNNFNFGVSVESEAIPTLPKVVSGPWIVGDWRTNNTDWLSQFSQEQNSTKVPYQYLYITAGKARADWGLQDCNVGADVTKTLCYNGANYIRFNKEFINNSYIAAANSIKNSFGATKEIVLHIEPDFWQYTSSSQNGGGLSYNEAQTMMNQWTTSIKQILPNSTLVLDISPWNSDLQKWSAGFNNFDYAGMVGKKFSPLGDGSVPAGIDGKTYAQISTAVGKKLILDDSHGVGGAWLGFDYDWTNSDLVQKRINDGITAVILPPNDISTLNTLYQKYATPNSFVTSSSSAISSNSPVITATSSITTNSTSSIVLPQTSSLSSAIITTKSSASSSSVRSALSPILIPITVTNTISNFDQTSCVNNLGTITLNKSTTWNNGYNAIIKVKNNSNTNINYWDTTIALKSGQTINSVWNMTQSGNQFRPAYNWNKTIAPGQELEVGGITLGFTTNNSVPTINCNIIR
jgi:Cellulose binding domain